MADDVTTAGTTVQGSDSLADTLPLPAPGYRVGNVIGRGGMGEVVAAEDLRIGRDVAIKRMSSSAPSRDSLARFLREARIQARLDHPAIVPVYELGTDADDRPFFTMKRLAGETLYTKLEGGAPTQRLLRAFAEVCLAIELAHSRGIVHRDLKPANIMLGDYGEVYVLDWGVARELGRPDAVAQLAAGGTQTQEGSVLGTFGYMSPEQLDDSSRVGPATDVYALGAILFEILTGATLHPRGPGVLASMMATDVSPAKRFPDAAIAPELDAACVAALATTPGARPTARALGDQVQRYLDGDRDLETRRVMARELVAKARAALGDPARRGEAVHDAGRALALDPNSLAAAELVTQLIVEPPPVMPPALVDALAASESASARDRARKALGALGLLGLLGVFAPLLSLAHVGPLVAIYGSITFSAVLCWRTIRTGRIYTPLVVISTLILTLTCTRIAGPYLLVPALAAGTLLSVAAIPWMSDRAWSVAAYVIVMTLTPIALESAGVLSSTSEVQHGELIMHSAIFEIRGQLDLIMLGVATLGFMLVVGAFARGVIHARRTAQRALEVQAWHLRQLVAPLRS